MFFIYIVILCYAGVVCGQELEAGDPCNSNDGTIGVCKYIALCKTANIEFERTGTHTLPRCGFVDDKEIVCCLPDVLGDRFASVTEPPKGPVPATKPQDNSLIFDSAHEPKTSTVKNLRKADAECQKLIAAAPPPLGSYIIGGESVGLGEFPHMVSLGYPTRKESDKGLLFKCGGSLISQSYVMTAAHCVVARSMNKGEIPTLIRAGVLAIHDPDRYDPTLDYEIETIIPHPEYSRKTHDIALLKLKTPVPITSQAQPACLFTRSDEPKTGYITGWGYTSFGGERISTSLLKANVTIINTAQCKEHYKSINLRDLKNGITDKMICAGGDGKDSCQGDSGGPLQAQTESDGHYRILGVTSFGVGCGTTIPGVYTRVSQYLDWIESVVWSEKSA